MTEHTLHKQLEQIEANLTLAAEELGVPDHRTADDPAYADRKKSFFTGKPTETNKSEDQKAAERVNRVAEDSIVIAEAAGVPSYRVSGEATSAAEKHADLFDPRQEWIIHVSRKTPSATKQRPATNHDGTTRGLGRVAD
jgi:hypothetical protein